MADTAVTPISRAGTSCLQATTTCSALARQDKRGAEHKYRAQSRRVPMKNYVMETLADTAKGNPAS
jgi:hypothetical protein